MMRTLLVAAILAALLVALPLRHPMGSAVACGIGPEPLEDIVRDAETIVLGTVVSAGDSGFTLPQASPTSASPLLPTPTRASVRPDLDLTGVGAELDVVTVYKGPRPRRTHGRSNVRARALAMIATLSDDVSPPCDVAGFAPRFRVGGQYYVFVDEDGDRRTLAIALENAVVDLAVNAGNYQIQVSRQTYDRFLAMFNVPFEDAADGLVRPTGQAPQAAIEFLVLALSLGDEFFGSKPSGIVAPNTGTAGLKATP